MATKTPKKHDHEALDKLYLDADGVDNPIFIEMRSNLLLISGEHYNTRKSTKFSRRVETSKELSDQQKIRLTKNHIQKICKLYVNNIVSMAPGVGIKPKNEKELADQKSAELHHAVWLDAKEKYRVDELIDDWAEDFVGIGEVATKIFFDPNAGDIQNYAQKLDDNGAPLHLDAAGEETTQPVDEMGQPHQLAEGDPIYAGEFVFEPIHGFNLLRAPEAKEMKRSPYLIIRKMVDKDLLMAQYGSDPAKAKFINESQDETMLVFDQNKSGYRNSKNEVLVREFYFRPCPMYPKGHWYFDTREGILDEGALPGGIFPIISQHFDKIQTTPRGRSPVKIMRPYQVEINRAASKIAEHQVTLGDDKLVMRNGGKANSGANLPGVRTINVTGGEPVVIAGRDGSQYLQYMQAQIEELYKVMMVGEQNEDTSKQVDPYTLLFQAGHNKKKFQRYIRRFERFLIDVCKTYLSLAKIHMSDEEFIYVAGKNEAVNIEEFKNADDLCYQISLEAMSDDLETKMGKQLVLNHLVQYTGNKLDKEDIGKLVRLMPYANLELGFEDLTLDYDSGTNDLLALDRGKKPPIQEYDNHIYLVKRATTRMRQPSFQMLDQQIQANYSQYVTIHQQFQAVIEQKIQAAKDGFIPISGALVAVEVYVPNPSDPTKEPKRARLPYDSVQWLIKRLETQGQNLQSLESMNQGRQAQLGDMIASNQQGGPGNGIPGRPTPQAPQGNAGGVESHGNPGYAEHPVAAG